MKAFAPLCLCLTLCVLTSRAQDSILLVGKITRKYTSKVEQKAQKIEQGLDKQSEQMMQRLQKQQQKAYIALHKLDSNAAKAYLLNSQQQYTATLSKLKDKTSKATHLAGSYVPGLDSMTGVLKYMDKLPTGNNLPGKDQIAGALAAGNKASQSLAQAEEIKKLVRQQGEQLKALASRYKDLPITMQLKQYNKELYYYSQRVQQAKETLNDPTKIEQAVLGLLRKNEGFKSWMSQNGQLAQLFGGAGGSTATNPAQMVAGLQTRQSVQGLVQSRLGGTLQQAQQMMASQLQQAQGQLSSMRNSLQQQISGRLNNTLNKLPGSGSGEIAMPDFKPNNQKTKTLLQRLEYGINLQSKGRSSWQPSTTDIGLSLGYKLNDKSAIGVGAAYKLGWGEPIKNIHFSHQGIGLRSYIDYKLKGSLWLSGGYEQNYNSSFHSFDVLKDFSAWQYSGLIGFNKKIKSGKRTVETKLLWDFLSYQQIPKTQAIVFRVEYKFK